VLNRKHPTLTELFKSGKGSKGSKLDDKTKAETIRTKLTKVNLRAAISRRFKAQISERVVSKFPEFQIAQEFDQYCELIEKMLN